MVGRQGPGVQDLGPGVSPGPAGARADAGEAEAGRPSASAPDAARPSARPPDAAALVERLRGWAADLGFSQIGIAGVDLAGAEPGLAAWLQAGFHGSMAYMARHGMKRARPAELVPGTTSVITVRMDYLPREANGGGATAPPAGAPAAGEARDPPGWIAREQAALAEPGTAVVSLYARGRDYHKVLRSRLQQLADRLAAEVGPLGHRVFCDSAPVLEAELATRAGLGWRGKHTLVLARDAGSMFFLGELFVDLELPPTPPAEAHCGRCTACLDACPTAAIVEPYRLDARRCISYLTIEHEGPIPPALRRAVGNRVYGCDDCQTACPWNKYARRSALPDFDVRDGFGHAPLLALWAWDEAEFGRRTEGSAIRRIGHRRWRRNLAVALGNALHATSREAPSGEAATAVRQALAEAPDTDPLVREHVAWARMQDGAAGG